ncbi:MAG: hypothetical protein DIU78_008300 [Pseudomonadota bacterium]|nr:MAG: hypothetical protein DIU78_11290 [Pseudomonadota bacterium]
MAEDVFGISAEGAGRLFLNAKGHPARMLGYAAAAAVLCIGTAAACATFLGLRARLPGSRRSELPDSGVRDAPRLTGDDVAQPIP